MIVLTLTYIYIWKLVYSCHIAHRHNCYTVLALFTTKTCLALQRKNVVREAFIKQPCLFSIVDISRLIIFYYIRKDFFFPAANEFWIAFSALSANAKLNNTMSIKKETCVTLGCDPLTNYGKSNIYIRLVARCMETF